MQVRHRDRESGADARLWGGKNDVRIAKRKCGKCTQIMQSDGRKPKGAAVKTPCPGIWADGMAGGTRVYPQRQTKAYTYIHHARRRVDGSDPTAGTRDRDETRRGLLNATRAATRWRVFAVGPRA